MKTISFSTKYATHIFLQKSVSLLEYRRVCIKNNLTTKTPPEKVKGGEETNVIHRHKDRRRDVRRLGARLCLAKSLDRNQNLKKAKS